MKNNKSRRLSLSPVQREILWMLDEAGDEYITTVLNTLREIFLDRSNDDLVASVGEAIRDLYNNGLIGICRDMGRQDLRWLPLSSDEICEMFPINQVLLRDEIQGYWVWNESRGGQYRVSLVLTEQGQQVLKK